MRIHEFHVYFTKHGFKDHAVVHNRTVGTTGRKL